MAYTPTVNAGSLQLYLGLCGTGKATASSTTLSEFAGGTLYAPNAAIFFKPEDVGMPIAIVGGGPVDPDMPAPNFVQGSLFHTTIATYVSATEVTLTDAPDTSIWNTGFATVILYRPCPFASDVATLPSDGLPFQWSSSIAPGTADTLQFTVLNSLGGDLGVTNPYIERFGTVQLGQPVYLKSTDSSIGDIFGGYIDTVTTSSMPGVSTPYSWACTCTSWTGLAKRRQVPPMLPQSFVNVAGDVVFRKLVLYYCDNDGVSVTSSTAPAITLAAPVGANVGQLLDQVVSQISTADTAWYWTSDPWRNFILTTRTANAAPWDVTDGSDLFSGQTPYSQSIVATHNQMANFVYAIGSAVLTNTLNANFVGNGVATVFNTPVNVGAEPAITLNAVSQTVGILGVDTGKDWYWSQGSTAITQDVGGTVLGSSDSLVVTYTPETPAVAQSPNVVSLQQRQAVEGTSGEFDYSFKVDQPILPADLLDLAAAYQIEYGDPATTCHFYTLRPGLATGQLQNITLPQAAIDGSFLIATMRMTIFSNVILWEYTAFGGANIGDAITALTQFINREQATGQIITPSTPIAAAATPVSGNYNSGPNEIVGVPNPIPFHDGVNEGDLLIAIVAGNNYNSTPALTDTLGNTYTQAVSGHNPGFFPNWVHILYAISVASGANSVTTPGSGSTTVLAIPGAQIDLTAIVDVTGSNSGTPPTLTVTNAHNVVVTGMCMDATSDVPTATAPEVVVGYTLSLGPASDGAAAVETVSASGSFTSTLASAAPNPIYASVSFNRAPGTAPPAQTITVQANPQGTVTHMTGALTSGEPVIGNGGADVKAGTKQGNTTQLQCASGAAGATGAPLIYDASGNAVAGATGQLVPSGGASGYVLTKNSATNYDTAWELATSDITVNGVTTLTIVEIQSSQVWEGQTIIEVNGTII